MDRDSKNDKDSNPTSSRVQRIVGIYEEMAKKANDSIEVDNKAHNHEDIKKDIIEDLDCDDELDMIIQEAQYERMPLLPKRRGTPPPSAEDLFLVNQDRIVRQYRNYLEPNVGIRDNVNFCYDFYCNNCALTFTDETSLNDHYLLVHTEHTDDSDDEKEDDEENDFNPCRCNRCNRVFSGDSSYEKHHCRRVNYEPPEEIDNIPQNLFGRHGCPICNNRYGTANLLGEHFIIAHSNFTDLSVLDDQVSRLGFPGLELLEYVGMIEKVHDDDIFRLICFEEQCPICYLRYRDVDDHRTSVGTELEDGYGSDSELKVRRRIELRNRFQKEDEKVNYHKAIKEPKLLEIIERHLNKSRLPCKLSCCETLMCTDCLEKHVSITDTIVCPFCKKDHTRTDVDYIVYIEECYEIDKKRWLPWWMRHLDIFI